MSLASKIAMLRRAFGRLARDQRGNTIAIVAASVIPLAAMIGSGVDMSRNYLVRSHLQQACDAGALAGMKNYGLSQNATSATTQANSYFDANFTRGAYGSTGLSRTFSVSSTTPSIVSGTASVTVPTTLMKIFGYNQLSFSVNCSSTENTPNVDVMFVLDNTGSMNNPAVTGDPTSKIDALKSAITQFYNTLQANATPGTQIRYGFVPYSSSVNVGPLLQRDWMANNWTYQSRVATPTGSYNPPVAQSTTGYVYVSGNKSTSTTSKAYSCPSSTYKATHSTSQTQTTNPDGSITIIKTTTKVETGVQITNCKYSGGRYSYTSTTYSTYKSKDVTTYNETPIYTWTYQPVTFDVSGLKGNNADGTMAGGSVTAAVGSLDSNSQPTEKTVAWNGCIEERQTAQNIDFTQPIPTSAHDLDINSVPSTSDPTTQWGPALSGLVYERALYTDAYGNLYGSFSTSNQVANYDFVSPADYTAYGWDSCPAQAQTLQTMTLTQIQAYENTMYAGGGTYHDIGMLWGARLISPTGLFAALNNSAPNGGPIQRYLILMTDGLTQSSDVIYGAYGVDPIDNRKVTPYATSSVDNDVINRTQYICNQVKNMNVTIWTIAFGSDAIDPNTGKQQQLLINCATDPSDALIASNAAALQTQFQQIAAKIADLRLTK